MQRFRQVVAVASAALALVLGFLWWRSGHQTDRAGDATVWAPSASASQATPGSAGTTGRAPSSPASASSTSSTGTSSSPTASTTTLPAGCDATATPITPTRVTIKRMGVDSPVLSLGLADDGSPATPPFSQPQTMGWYNLGPRPGAAKGKAVLTAHTFHDGGALGNKLYDQDSGLKAGDVIALSDARGHTQCYRYTAASKVDVASYDPNSTVIYDANSSPELAIVICWDYKASSKFWASRIVFHATPLAH